MGPTIPVESATADADEDEEDVELDDTAVVVVALVTVLVEVDEEVVEVPADDVVVKDEVFEVLPPTTVIPVALTAESA